MNMDTITTMFTPAQAAVITGLSLREVQKAIDNRVVPAKRSRQGKQIRRYLSQDALVCLHVGLKGLSLFPLATRKRMITEILKGPALRRVSPSLIVTVDLQPSRRAILEAVKLLRKAESMVSSNPEVMSGAVVFKGTRVPVQQIALEVESGGTLEEILEDYPSVSREQAELATLYMRAHPNAGRPKAWKSLPAYRGVPPFKVIQFDIPGLGELNRKLA